MCFYEDDRVWMSWDILNICLYVCINIMLICIWYGKLLWLNDKLLCLFLSFRFYVFGIDLYIFKIVNK